MCRNSLVGETDYGSSIVTAAALATAGEWVWPLAWKLPHAGVRANNNNNNNNNDNNNNMYDFFFGHAHCIEKFLGQESNQYHSNNNAGSLTHWATRELHEYEFLEVEVQELPRVR